MEEHSGERGRLRRRAARRGPLGIQALLAVLAVTGGVRLVAQDLPPFVRYALTGEEFGDLLGSSMAALGDVDGDGIPDFAVGAPEEHYTEGVAPTGRVLVVSGKNGEVIRSWRSEEPWHGYGGVVASAGDLDGDAVNDVLAEGPYFIEMRSGRTGELLRTVRDRTFNPGGVALSPLGDVDSDGMPDFAVGNPQPDDSLTGRMHVYSGRTGERLWTLVAERERNGFAATVAGVGDIDLDGKPDLAVATPKARDHEDPGFGTVRMLRGHDGSEIFRLSLGVDSDSFGSGIASLSDVDADGVRDVAIGARNYPVRGFPGGGRVDLYSAGAEKLLWSVTGQDFERSQLGQYFGGDAIGDVMASAGDADGDGLDDLLVLSIRGSIAGFHSSRVALHSGKTGAPLAVYEAEKDDATFGWVLSGLGDIDGDGRAEFLIGAPEYFIQELPPPQGPWLSAIGRVYAVSYRPEGDLFIRGDADIDGDVDLSDGVAILLHLFHGGPVPCEEAMDVNRSRMINLTDAGIIFYHLFLSGMAPIPPYPDCGRFDTFTGRLPCQDSFCQ